MKKEIILKVSDTYVFELESHAGGGYSCTPISNNEEITEVRLKSRKPDQGITLNPVGKGFPVEVEIKALAKGRSVVLLEEKRAWERETQPLNSCRIKITVK